MGTSRQTTIGPNPLRPWLLLTASTCLRLRGAPSATPRELTNEGFTRRLPWASSCQRTPSAGNTSRLHQAILTRPVLSGRGLVCVFSARFSPSRRQTAPSVSPCPRRESAGPGPASDGNRLIRGMYPRIRRPGISGRQALEPSHREPNGACLGVPLPASFPFSILCLHATHTSFLTPLSHKCFPLPADPTPLRHK